MPIEFFLDPISALVPFDTVFVLTRDAAGAIVAATGPLRMAEAAAVALTGAFTNTLIESPADGDELADFIADACRPLVADAATWRQTYRNFTGHAWA